MTHLLDLTGEEIAELDDGEFRALVAKLCESQLSRLGLPATAVTWGGDQRARDGGLDIRVTLPVGSVVDSVVPRANTGFQVKHADMPASAIRHEMRPGGVLRPLILELIQQDGAYIIACAQGSTSEIALRSRKEAMQEAVADVVDSDRLHIDFYDRGRVATAVREHPALIPWVREKIGRPMRGWYSYGRWPRAPAADSVYLVDGQSRLRDGRHPEEEPCGIVDGINRLRTLLSRPNASVRLVGLSGTGKTRLVQALFDSRVGHHAISDGLSVYCDFSDEPVPTPAEMIQQLKRKGAQAVVVVDNCPPEAHQTLTSHCLGPGGSVSLLTVEFDVRDDIPEHTDAFKLEPASDGVIESLLQRERPEVTEVDRRRIAQFSGGNARIAMAIGSGVRIGDSISTLSDRDLFRRLFYQGQGSNDSLLRAAEAASLVYSFNGDTSSEVHPELDALARLAEMSVGEFHRHMNTLHERNLVQRRGVWRALLPQALADMLARDALAGIPLANVTRSLTQSRQPRLTTSFTRRLGSLHDSEEARRLVALWLQPGGMLGDWGEAVLTHATQFQNVAPVVPEAALTAMERWANGPAGDEFLAPRALHRSVYVQVVAAIAYEPATFARAAWLLAAFASKEPEGQRHNGARRALSQLCRVMLSGTLAPLTQRLDLVRRLAQSPSPQLQGLAVDAYDAMMNDGPFISFSALAFGSRSRDHGLQPATSGDVTSWFGEMLQEAASVALSQRGLAATVRVLIAKHLATFWRAGLPDQLERICSELACQAPWLEGWIAAKKLLLQMGERMSTESRGRLESMIQQIQPRGIAETARAYIFSEPWSSLDIVDDDLQLAASGAEMIEARSAAEFKTEQLGQELSLTPNFGGMLPDLMSSKAYRAASFAKGLAAGTDDLRLLWRTLVDALESLPERRNCSALLGFLQGAHERDDKVTHEFLDDAASRPSLRACLPALQLQVSSDERGLDRLEEVLRDGATPAWSFDVLRFGRHSDSIPPDRLCGILMAIARLSEGLPVAVGILVMRLLSDKRQERQHPDALLRCARDLLRLVEFDEFSQTLDHHLSELVRASLGQPEADAIVAALCAKLFPLDSMSVPNWFSFDQLLHAMVETRPIECLDALFGEGISDHTRQIMMLRPLREGVFDVLPQATILDWARRDAEVRFPVVALGLSPLKAKDESSPPQWSDTALAVLAAAPDRLAALEAFASQFVPTSWSGSRAAIIENRRALLTRFIHSSDARESAWAREEDAHLASIAVLERAHERQRHEGFEP